MQRNSFSDETVGFSQKFAHCTLIIFNANVGPILVTDRRYGQQPKIAKKNSDILIIERLACPRRQQQPIQTLS